ncbi:PD-(D/E)XK nuclease-like domain-containing protein [Bacillus cihuensis]|uniref:PD-(D/E)XK nuclease-like domain-containing protein n=1 Tax=Bacillus cihuensis TaxID=1208599 RepID=UPI0004085060|nr:PD-(D/E)XK nuclease-like domain-containing protein [Bacillus cihuensis]
MEINKDNYYSKEIDRHYFSVSQYKSFLKCEAATMAKLNRDYEEPKSDALLFGSYVHSWLDDTQDQFKEENPILFSTRGATKGQMKAEYKLADEMIKVLKLDPFVMMALQGEKEIIMTGDLFGAPWKIRMDVYNPRNGRFADLKTVKGIYEKYWREDIGYCSFVEAYGYITQMAVYTEIESQNRGGDWLENFIVAVSKQDPPDKAVITVDHTSLNIELEDVQKNMERFIAVKSGVEKPDSCGTCHYCRRNKMLNTVLDYRELIG